MKLLFCGSIPNSLSRNEIPRRYWIFLYVFSLKRSERSKKSCQEFMPKHESKGIFRTSAIFVEFNPFKSWSYISWQTVILTALDNLFIIAIYNCFIIAYIQEYLGYLGFKNTWIYLGAKTLSWPSRFFFSYLFDHKINIIEPRNYYLWLAICNLS